MPALAEAAIGATGFADLVGVDWHGNHVGFVKEQVEFLASGFAFARLDDDCGFEERRGRYKSARIVFDLCGTPQWS